MTNLHGIAPMTTAQIMELLTESHRLIAEARDIRQDIRALTPQPLAAFFTPTTSPSSDAMSRLMAWRNQDGKEENWISHPVSRRIENIGSAVKHACKLVIAEICLPVIAVAAIAEVCFWLHFSAVAAVIGDRSQLRRSVNMISSSSFTALWALGNALCLCFPGWPNISTNESFARQHTPFFRPEDQREIDRIRLPAAAPAPAPAPAATPSPQSGSAAEIERIDRGAQFFKNHILDEADEATRTRIQELHEDMFIFVLTKTVFTYSLGSKREDTLPDFLNADTLVGILGLRERLSSLNSAAREELAQLINDPDHSKEIVEGESREAIKAAFNDIREIAHKEINNSLFITKCWQKACS